MVWSSRKKSIGSMVLPASTQPPRRSWAKMKTSGPLPRGTVGGDLVGDTRRRAPPVWCLERDVRRAGVVRGDDLLERGLLVAAIGVPDRRSPPAAAAARAGAVARQRSGGTRRSREDVRSIVMARCSVPFTRPAARSSFASKRCIASSIDHELDGRPPRRRETVRVRAWRPPVRRRSGRARSTSCPSGSTISTLRRDAHPGPAAVGAPRPGARGGCRAARARRGACRAARASCGGTGSVKPGAAMRSAVVLIDGAKHVHGRRADELGDEQVGRPLVDLERRADLLQLALAP